MLKAFGLDRKKGKPISVSKNFGSNQTKSRHTLDEFVRLTLYQTVFLWYPELFRFPDATVVDDLCTVEQNYHIKGNSQTLKLLRSP